MMAEDCREKIASEEYVDILIRYRSNFGYVLSQFGNYCRQYVDDNWLVVYAPVAEIPPLDFGIYGYYSIPKLYGLMEKSSMIESGIVRVQNQRNLELFGQDVIIGFVDTGIDYLHEAFMNELGRTRIISIWDQTDNTGNLPGSFLFGSEYTQDEINRAIESDSPYEIVPQKDEPNGHGTFMAGIAAGSIIGEDFTGAAPKSSIVMVKLRPAKQALKDFYFINQDADAYSETDIMLGIRYLKEKAVAQNKPLVVCLGLGTSYGPHTSGTPLSQYLNELSDFSNTAVIVAMGNEGNSRHHYFGKIESSADYETVEIRVGEGERGFLLELWAQQPDVFSVSIISPSGESISRIQPQPSGSRKIEFVFEKTVIYVDYKIAGTINGNQFITMRFDAPSSGIWKVLVYDDNVLSGMFNMWLPINNFLSADTFFLASDVNTTLTQPASAYNPISVGAYDHRNNSIWIDSGRGNAADQTIKPELAAPGVNVYGPVAGGTHDRFTTKSGTGFAAAHVAGAAALLFEWRLRNDEWYSTNTRDIKSLLILGADRNRNIVYPSKEWGYGTLDVYNIFESLINR